MKVMKDQTPSVENKSKRLIKYLIPLWCTIVPLTVFAIAMTAGKAAAEAINWSTAVTAWTALIIATYMATFGVKYSRKNAGMKALIPALILAVLELSSPQHASAMPPQVITDSNSGKSYVSGFGSNVTLVGAIAVKGDDRSLLSKEEAQKYETSVAPSVVGKQKCNVFFYIVVIIIGGIIVYLIYKLCERVLPNNDRHREDEEVARMLPKGSVGIMVSACGGMNTPLSGTVMSSTNVSPNAVWQPEITISATNGFSGYMEVRRMDGSLIHSFELPTVDVNAVTESADYSVTFMTNSPAIQDALVAPSKFYRFLPEPVVP